MDAPLTAMGTTCAAHRHREMVPMERHHVWPKGDGGPDVPSNIAVVCSNAHSGCHHLLSLMLRAYDRDTTVPWTVRRRYGKGVRRLAEQGFAAIIGARQR